MMEYVVAAVCVGGSKEETGQYNQFSWSRFSLISIPACLFYSYLEVVGAVS